MANAIDIAGFVTADGRTIEVARFWGPTARDIREAERIAAPARQGRARRQGRQKPEAAKAEPAKTRRSTRVADAQARSAIADQVGRAAAGQGSAARRRCASHGAAAARTSARRTPRPMPPPSSAVEARRPRRPPKRAFLRRLHKGACGTFGTVLGPEANEAHRDHFHFDLAARRRSAFCE